MSPFLWEKQLQKEHMFVIIMIEIAQGGTADYGKSNLCSH